MKLLLSILVLLATLSGTSQLPVGSTLDADYPVLKECHNCTNKTWTCNGKPEVLMEDIFNVESFTWEFTQTAPVPGAAWEYTTTSVNTQLPRLCSIESEDRKNLLEGGATYDVRIKANYRFGGSSGYGPLDCMQFSWGSSSGSSPNGMEMNQTFQEVDDCGNYYNPLSIYPNPSNGEFFNLNICELKPNDFTLKIKDLHGRTVHHQAFSNVGESEYKDQNTFIQQIEIDLTSGNYMVDLRIGNKVYSTQLVVLR